MQKKGVQQYYGGAENKRKKKRGVRVGPGFGTGFGPVRVGLRESI